MAKNKFKTNKGKELEQIDRNTCKRGDKVFYVYEHTNGTEYWTRIIPAIFVTIPNSTLLFQKDIVVIKRGDCKGNSRVPISKVYIELNLEVRNSSQP